MNLIRDLTPQESAGAFKEAKKVFTPILENDDSFLKKLFGGSLINRGLCHFQ
jgi:hypothetical protein